jgi:hypothetical protein
MNETAVISLADESGVMVEPWAEAGYQCYCVDIAHSIRKDRVEGNIHYVWGDVRSWFPPVRPLIMFAFPPCTDLSVSGARDFKKKRGYRLADALELFDACKMAGEWSGVPYLIENPVGRLSSHVGKPDYYFDPCDFTGFHSDDNYTKKTCLWTGNGFVMPGKFINEEITPPDDRIHKAPPTDDRAQIRSLTPTGFARAVYEANKFNIRMVA